MTFMTPAQHHFFQFIWLGATFIATLLALLSILTAYIGEHISGKVATFLSGIVLVMAFISHIEWMGNK